MSCDDLSRQGNENSCPEVDATNVFYVAEMSLVSQDSNTIQSATDTAGALYDGHTVTTIWDPDQILVLREEEFSDEINGFLYDEFKKNSLCNHQWNYVDFFLLKHMEMNTIIDHNITFLNFQNLFSTTTRPQRNLIKNLRNLSKF